MTEMRQVVTAIRVLKDFVAQHQLDTMGILCRGEEGEFFRSKIVEMAELINNMPKTYEQDGKMDDAIAYLHYFAGGYDGYIIEKDRGDGTDDTSQYQAFGLVSLAACGGDPEMGYISIVELQDIGMELDLHFTPKTIREIKCEIEARWG